MTKNSDDLLEMEEMMREMAKSDINTAALYATLNEYMSASEDFLEASKLVGNDEIKSEMISGLFVEIENVWARDEGLRAVVQRLPYDRQQIISEMNEISKIVRDISRRIREKLEGLQ